MFFFIDIFLRLANGTRPYLSVTTGGFASDKGDKQRRKLRFTARPSRVLLLDVRAAHCLRNVVYKHRPRQDTNVSCIDDFRPGCSFLIVAAALLAHC